MKLLAIACACLIGLSVAPVRGQSQTRLTAQQVLRLIAARTPDRIVAAEIAERGLRDVIDRELIERIRRGGAGALTINALDRIRPRAVLIITGVPGTTIEVANGGSGRLGQDGTFALSDLWPGRYDISATLYEHTPARQSIVLAANQKSTIELSLVPVYGFLSLTTSADRATIEVNGQSRSAPLSRQRLPAGVHEVRIVAPYRESHVERIEISGGASVERHIDLKPSIAELNRLSGRIAQSYASRDFRSTIDGAVDYLEAAGEAESSGKIEMLTYLTRAQLASGAYADAAISGARAITGGGALSLDVIHHHGSGIVEPHQARLVVSMHQIVYEPIARCLVSAGSVDGTRVGIQLLRNARLSRFQAQTSDSAIQMKIPKPNDPGEFTTLNFIDADENRLATIVRLLQASTTRAIPPGLLNSSSLPGRYTRRDVAVDFIELKPDGTFTAQQGGQSLAGTFTLSGSLITVRAGKRTETARIEGTRIVDVQGFVWEKPIPPGQ